MNARDQEYSLDPRTGRWQRAALVAGIAGAAAAAAGYFLSGPDRFFQSYLIAFVFVLGLALGSLAIAMLHYLVGGGWGLTIRRIVEAGAKTLWLAALMFLPLLLGLPYLYPWARPDLVAESHALQEKAVYLNAPFFIARAAVYFAIWIFLSRQLTRWSLRPEYNLEPERRRIFQRFSAIGLMLYVLTMSFAAIDWLMSLQPGWLSATYGLLIITTQVLAGLAFALMILPLLTGGSLLAGRVHPGLFRDLGALLLSAVIFWAYIAYSQLLIIWAGNLPREAVWYTQRTDGGWAWVAVLVILAEFLLPFLVLLSLRAKRSLRVLVLLSLMILVTNLVYYYWEVIPAFHPGSLSIHWLDFALPLALGGLWLALFFRELKRTPQRWLPGAEALHGAEEHEKIEPVP